MFVGMAMAKYWDVDWELYSKVEDHYTHLRDSKDFDHMDVEILWHNLYVIFMFYL